jgi:hypothetical protein
MLLGGGIKAEMYEVVPPAPLLGDNGTPVFPPWQQDDNAWFAIELTNYYSLSEDLRDKIQKHTAAKFVVEQVDPAWSNMKNGEISIPRFTRFEFELKARERTQKLEYAGGESREISVTYYVVLDPAFRSSREYKAMNDAQKLEFETHEKKISQQSKQEWVSINWVCVMSETNWGVKKKFFGFFRDDPTNCRKEILVGTHRLLYENDEIIEQVRAKLLSEFQMQLVFV